MDAMGKGSYRHILYQAKSVQGEICLHDAYAPTDDFSHLPFGTKKTKMSEMCSQSDSRAIRRVKTPVKQVLQFITLFSTLKKTEFKFTRR
jgi:hypothetical protein